MKITRDEHGLGFWLKLEAFQYFDGFGFYNFCLTRFGLELMIFFWTSLWLSAILGIKVIEIPHSTRLTFLLQIQIQCYMWCNHIATLLPPFTRSRRPSDSSHRRIGSHRMLREPFRCHREPFVSATMLRHPEPIKEKAEPTTLSITAIKLSHLTRFTCYYCCELNVICCVLTLPHGLRPVNQITYQTRLPDLPTIHSMVLIY